MNVTARTTIPMRHQTVRNIAKGLRRDANSALSAPLLARMRKEWENLDVDEVAHTLATGRDDKLGSEARTALGDRTMFDPITTELLTDLGLDPAGVLLLAAIASPDPVTLLATLRLQTPDAAVARTTVPLSAEVSWNAPEGELFVLGPIPETLATALPGRRLREWLSHHVLDRHDLVMESVRITNVATRIRVAAPQERSVG